MHDEARMRMSDGVRDLQHERRRSAIGSASRFQ